MTVPIDLEAAERDALDDASLIVSVPAGLRASRATNRGCLVTVKAGATPHDALRRARISVSCPTTAEMRV